MSHKKARYEFKPKDVSVSQKLTLDRVITLISLKTGYAKKDIRKVLKGYHLVLCDEFSSGKILYTAQPFYTLRVQKLAGSLRTDPNGIPFTIPDRHKVRFTPGSAFNTATGFITRAMKANMNISRKLREKKGQI